MSDVIQTYVFGIAFTPRLKLLQGNTHITVKHPNGRETYTINGVEQPSGAIEAPRPYHDYQPARSNKHRSPSNPPYEIGEHLGLSLSCHTR